MHRTGARLLDVASLQSEGALGYCNERPCRRPVVRLGLARFAHAMATLAALDLPVWVSYLRHFVCLLLRIRKSLDRFPFSSFTSRLQPHFALGILPRHPPTRIGATCITLFASSCGFLLCLSALERAPYFDTYRAACCFVSPVLYSAPTLSLS